MVFKTQSFLCLAICAKKLEIQNSCHFGGTKFFENWVSYSANLPCGSKISSKSLYLARFLRYKWPPFLASKNVFKTWKGYSSQTPCGSNFFFFFFFFCEKIRKYKMTAIFHRTYFFLKDTNSFVFCIFEKNSKIQNGYHFWQVKYSLKLRKASLHRYPMDQKFCRNRSISHGFRDTSENSKWPSFLVGQNFFKTGSATQQRYPVVKKMLKSLYLARFSRNKHFCVLHF